MGPAQGPIVIITNRSTGAPVLTRLAPELETPRVAVATDLAALGADAVVGVEAHLRLGYLDWATGDDAGALAEYEAALRGATDPDSRYLAYFLRGVAERSRRNVPAAAAAFEAALRERPRSQSASLALAAIELQAGRAERADELARASIDHGAAGDHGAADDDPWRLFLYGRYPQLADLLKALRSEVAR
jgi:tetratricopeptide (TPR) repeat protein